MAHLLPKRKPARGKIKVPKTEKEKERAIRELFARRLLRDKVDQLRKEAIKKQRENKRRKRFKINPSRTGGIKI